jgi:hypothetical protein
MRWTPLNFSKSHKGKTLPQVIFQDPDWFFWAVEEKIFDDRDYLKREAIEIYEKVKKIRIPQNGEKNLVALYILDDSHKFYSLHTIPQAQVQFWQGQPILHTTDSFIDLSVPRRLRGYDKLGYRLFIKDLKSILFGNSNYRMTQRRCEAFFNDDFNFLISGAETNLELFKKSKKDIE